MKPQSIFEKVNICRQRKLILCLCLKGNNYPCLQYEPRAVFDWYVVPYLVKASSYLAIS